MEEQRLKRLRYLRQNYKFLTTPDLRELDELEIQYANEQAYRSQELENKNNLHFSRSQMLAQQYSEGPIEEVPSYEPFEEEIPKKKKKKKRKKKSWLKRLFSFFLFLLLLLVGFFAYGYFKATSAAGGQVQATEFNGQATESGAINILLIGADQRPNQGSGVAHSDSIMILQLNPVDGKVKLVSILRDTLVYIPGYSLDGQQDLKINTAYTLGEQEETRQGAELLRKTIEQNFGIPCMYYALVDFSSFSSIVDSLFPSGVSINAEFGTINGEDINEVPVPDDLIETDGLVESDRTLTLEEASLLGYSDGGIYMMIQEGQQNMDGRTLLNYARFRHDDDNDFGRVKRQQQVIAAVIDELKNPITLFTSASALGTAGALIETNIPNQFLFKNSVNTLLDMRNGLAKYTIPDISQLDYENFYDQYGGLGLLIDLESYQSRIQNFMAN
ncbi:MAG: LCP family protein [Lactovum sp.]